jgi:hypothetical protein
MQAQAPSPPAAEAPSVAASKAPSAAPEQAASAPEGAAAKASSSASAPATPEVRRLAKQAPSSSAARTDAARDERSKRREPMAAAKPEDTAARQANAIAEPQPFPKAVDEVASAAAPAEPPASAAPPAPVASAASPAPQPAAAAASPLAESKSEAVKDQAKVAQSAPAAERTVREAAIEGQPTFKSRLAATTPSSADASSSAVDARAKMRASLPTDQWIALMRRLLVEQHYEELAKELAAFRSLHADANLLLPADLRDFRAPAPPR